MWGRLSLNIIHPNIDQNDNNNNHSTSNKKNPTALALTLPNIIDLDVSKQTHFIGRLPNPDESKFQHKVQHVLTVSYLSSTHCSITRVEEERQQEDNDNNNRNDHDHQSSSSSSTKSVKYILTDYSTNGTFINHYHNKQTQPLDIDSLKPIATVNNNSNNNNNNNNSNNKNNSNTNKNTKSVEIFDHDQIIFKFKGSATICYTFETIMVPPQVTGLGSLNSSNSNNNHHHGNTTTDINSSSSSSLLFNTANNNNANNNNTLHETQILQLQAEIHNLEDRIINYVQLIETLQKDSHNITKELSLQQEKNIILTNDILKITNQLNMNENHTSAIEAYNYKLKEINLEIKEKNHELLLKIQNITDDLKHKSDQVIARNLLIDELKLAQNEEIRLKNEWLTKYEYCHEMLQKEQNRNGRLTNANTILQAVACDREVEINTLKTNYNSLVSNLHQAKMSEDSRRKHLSDELIQLEKNRRQVSDQLIILENNIQTLRQVNFESAMFLEFSESIQLHDTLNIDNSGNNNNDSNSSNDNNGDGKSVANIKQSKTIPENNYITTTTNTTSSHHHHQQQHHNTINNAKLMKRKANNNNDDDDDDDTMVMINEEHTERQPYDPTATNDDDDDDAAAGEKNEMNHDIEKIHSQAESESSSHTHSVPSVVDPSLQSPVQLQQQLMTCTQVAAPDDDDDDGNKNDNNNDDNNNNNNNNNDDDDDENTCDGSVVMESATKAIDHPAHEAITTTATIATVTTAITNTAGGDGVDNGTSDMNNSIIDNNSNNNNSSSSSSNNSYSSSTNNSSSGSSSNNNNNNNHSNNHASGGSSSSSVNNSFNPSEPLAANKLKAVKPMSRRSVDDSDCGYHAKAKGSRNITMTASLLSFPPFLFRHSHSIVPPPLF